MIKQFYRVEVDIPLQVWEQFRDSSEFNRAVMDATRKAIESRTNYYGHPSNYAIYETREQAITCEKRLMNVNYYFAAKLTDPEENKP